MSNRVKGDFRPPRMYDDPSIRNVEANKEILRRFWADPPLVRTEVRNTHKGLANVEAMVSGMIARTAVEPSKCGECWVINTYIAGDYPQMRIRQKRWPVHRISHTLFVGPIAPNLLVCHRCDNKRCWNPDHFFLGTSKDNSHDAYQKGRLRPPAPRSGENHSRARLTDKDVDAIMAMKTPGATSREAATLFGVSQRHVLMLWQGRSKRSPLHSQYSLPKGSPDA